MIGAGTKGEEGGLKLPINIGAPNRTPVNRQIHTHWDTMGDIEAQVAALGFTDVTKPSTGAFPNLVAEDLTTNDSKQYTDRYVEFLAWWRYASEQVATLKAGALQIENEMEDIELEVKKEMKGTPGTGRGGTHTKDDLELAVGTHARFRELKLLLQRATQAKMLMETRLEYLERSLRLISRQVEIRRLDIEQGKTEHNMPGRGGPTGQTSPGGLPFAGRRGPL